MTRRERSVFYNALQYAVELEALEFNPVDKIRGRAQRAKIAESVGRRVVVSGRQARKLLTALSYVGERGRVGRGERLAAFFACLYFAALRERISLRGCGTRRVRAINAAMICDSLVYLVRHEALLSTTLEECDHRQVRTSEPDRAVKSFMLYRGANGDPTVEAQLVGNGDLRLLSIQRSGVWAFSDVDTIGWWTWHTVSRADLPRLLGEGGDLLEAVRAAVTPGPEDETDDDNRMGEIFRRFEAWLTEHGVPYSYDSYDEHEL